MRESYFSGSWYPARQHDVLAQIEKWDRELGPADQSSSSAIVPHAGWFFSGHLAYDAIRRLKKEVDVLVVAGGHLPGNHPLLFWSCSSCETPLGALEVQGEIRDILIEKTDSSIDDSPDNTIELQLPLLRYHFENTPVVPVRIPAGSQALDFVSTLKEVLVKKKLTAAFIGSTDLTHYGPNYSFTPRESLKNPEAWVKESDERILKAMIDGDGGEILRLAKTDRSACSAGAAAAASLWGTESSGDKGLLLNYETSLSRHPSSSFVGYGSVIYPC